MLHVKRHRSSEWSNCQPIEGQKYNSRLLPEVKLQVYNSLRY